MAHPKLNIGTGNIVTMLTSLDGYDITMNGVAAAPAGLVLEANENNIDRFSVGLGPTVQGTEGVVTLGSPTVTMTLEHGVTINNGALFISTSTAVGSHGGGAVTIDGHSTVDNGGYLNVFDRNGGGVTTLNGTITFSNASAGNFNFAPVQGDGTVQLESGSGVSMDGLLKGLHADVGATTTLNLFTAKQLRHHQRSGRRLCLRRRCGSGK